MESFVYMIFAGVLFYCVGLLIYLYRKATKDRFYELRDERRRKRVFSSAGHFVPKNRPHDSSGECDSGSPSKNQEE